MSAPSPAKRCEATGRSDREPTHSTTPTTSKASTLQLRSRPMAEQLLALRPGGDGYASQASRLAPGEPVQAEGGALTGAGVHEAAAHGVSGGGGTLPHLERIQQSFGAHDVSHVQAHVGGRAAEASAAMGAEAYATGDQVAFAGAPSLHTAAHEAAHVVQQRAGVSLSGGVGKAGDPYERHADAVADRVVAGQSAEDLLGAAAGGAGAVQAKTVQFNRDPKVIGTLAQGAYCQVVGLYGPLAGKPTDTDYCQIATKTSVWDKAKDDARYQIKSGGITGWVDKSALTLLNGVHKDLIFNQGQEAGWVDDSKINCLGHASGQGRGVYIGQTPLKDGIEGIGFSCAVGDHKNLAAHIKAGKKVMMVYLYMFKSSWRDDAADQALSYAELAKKYGWTQDAWDKPYVLFDKKNKSLPCDYHALTYNPVTAKWEWVGHSRAKLPNGSYLLDSKPTDPAASNPDLYFSSAQTITSIYCYQ